MDFFTGISLFALLTPFAVGTVANVLNVRGMRSELPAEFRGVYNEEEYRKSQRYTRAKILLGIAGGIFSLTVILVFWFAEGFNLLDIYFRSFGFAPAITGILYIGSLVVAGQIFSLPFGVYDTFVLEEEYGFNRTTPKTFVADFAKQLVLTLAIGGVILYAVLWLFLVAGAYAWVYAWAVVATVTLFLSFIAPRVFFPLFYKFTPLAEGELRERILGLASKLEFPVKEVYVIDGSRRSTKGNAFFVGFGKNKRIALYDTLIEKHTVPELVSVMAHEIGHYKKKHSLLSTLIGVLQSGLMLYLVSVFIDIPGFFSAFYMEFGSVYVGFALFGLLYGVVELPMNIAELALSRKFEYDADEFSRNATGEPLVMAEALKKLSRDSLSNLTPHPFYVFLHYSHPPVLERVRALKK